MQIPETLWVGMSGKRTRFQPLHSFSRRMNSWSGSTILATAWTGSRTTLKSIWASGAPIL